MPHGKIKLSAQIKYCLILYFFNTSNHFRVFKSSFFVLIFSSRNFFESLVRRNQQEQDCPSPWQNSIWFRLKTIDSGFNSGEGLAQCKEMGARNWPSATAWVPQEMDSHWRWGSQVALTTNGFETESYTFLPRGWTVLGKSVRPPCARLSGPVAKRYMIPSYLVAPKINCASSINSILHGSKWETWKCRLSASFFKDSLRYRVNTSTSPKQFSKYISGINILKRSVLHIDTFFCHVLVYFNCFKRNFCLSPTSLKAEYSLVIYSIL